MKLQYLFVFFILLLFSCGDDSAGDMGTISETDIGIMGTFITEEGVPSSDVHVAVYEVTDNAVGKPLATGTTNTSGVYKFKRFASGTYRIAGTKKVDTLIYTALVDEFVYDSIDLADSTIDVGVATLFPPGAVSGTVQLEGTEYHLGVDVFIPGTSFIGKSNSDGSFVISGIPKGSEYQLAAMFPGYTTKFSEQFSITAKDTTKLITPIKLTFDPSQTPPAPTGLIASFNSDTKIVRVVWDSVLHPNWNGFIVYRKDSLLTAADPEKVSGEQLITTTSYSEVIADYDPTKKVTLQYHVVSQDPNSNRSAFSEPAYVCLEETQHTAHSTIIGRVVTAEGLSAAAASVVLLQMGNNTLIAVDTVMTDASGAFLFSKITSGSYKIEASVAKQEGVLKNLSELFSFDSLASVTTPYNCGVDTLWQSGAVQGKVVLNGAASHTGILIFIPGTSFNAYTDAMGNYFLSDVSKGKYELNISHDGYVSIVSDSFLVHPAETTIIAPVTLDLDDSDTPSAPRITSSTLHDGKCLLTWEKVVHPGLSGYSVYRKSADNSAEDPQLISGSEIITTTSYSDDLSALPKDTYQYQLVSHGTNGNKSAYSSPVHVVWTGLPERIAITSPIDGTSDLDTSFQIVWNTKMGETYTLQVGTNATFTPELKNVPNCTPPYTMDGLSLDKTYYLRINASNENGTTIGKSSSFSTSAVSMTNPMMITVPAGTITDSEKRNAYVSSFLIMEHEVTVEMYRVFKPTYSNLLGESKPKHPVASVGWGDAIRYANWLSEQNGLTPCYTVVPGKYKRTDHKDPTSEYCKWSHDTLFYEFDTTANGYRLPTSDEWQHAASGGDDYNFDYATADGTIDSTKAWNDSRITPSEVKQFAPNPLGIYDMSCNVWEMVWGMASRMPEGRVNYVAPADSANNHGIKMGDGFYGGEGKYALPITRRDEWYDTYKYFVECGFRLARSIKN